MSILDTDLYKFTVGNIIYRNYPDYNTVYRLFDRTNKLNWTPDFIERVKLGIDNYAKTRGSYDDLIFLQRLGIDIDYIDYLRLIVLAKESVKIHDNSITVEGRWRDTVLWEVPLLSIISEAHYQHSISDKDYETLHTLKAQATKYDIKFAEFGTRRRRSFELQDLAISILCPILTGTSNIYFGRKYNLPIVGTYGHELPMGICGITGLENYANTHAFILSGKNYILSDTYTTNKFLEMEPRLFVNYDVRQDSGNPFEFIDKMLAFYHKWNVDSTKKTILFTDSLDIEKCARIRDYCEDYVRCAFGIGTAITNPYDDKLNTVIKLVQINGNKTYKLTDDCTKSIQG